MTLAEIRHAFCHESHQDGRTTEAYRTTCGRCGGDRRQPIVTVLHRHHRPERTPT